MRSFVARFRHSLAQKAGFTLIEMMVTVAIVGVAISIVGPQYCHYVAISRQKEAQSALSAIYMAEMAYRTENLTFTSCTTQLGLLPESAPRYYTRGWDTTLLAADGCGSTGLASCTTYLYNKGTSAAVTACAAADSVMVANRAAHSGTAIPAAANLDTTSADLTRTTFTARAAGSVASCTSGYDRWSINELKFLSNTKKCI